MIAPNTFFFKNTLALFVPGLRNSGLEYILISPYIYFDLILTVCVFLKKTTSCSVSFILKVYICSNDLRGHFYDMLNFHMYLGLFLDFPFYLFVCHYASSVLS